MKFEKQRTQPAIDLASRVDMETPGRIIDIGCGPGNSTAVLKERWQSADITGLDSSPAMIEEASKTYGGITWVCADASDDLSSLGTFDIVFSNAAIQWIPDHEKLLTNLFSLLNQSGLLAVQVPDVTHMPIHTALQALTKSDKWNSKLGSVKTHSNFGAPYYYDILSSLTPDIDLWETHYYHVMENHHSLVQWYGSTGLRPYLNSLETEDDKNAFLADFENALKTAYTTQSDGKVLFPFDRIFFIARKV